MSLSNYLAPSLVQLRLKRRNLGREIADKVDRHVLLDYGKLLFTADETDLNVVGLDPSGASVGVPALLAAGFVRNGKSAAKTYSTELLMNLRRAKGKPRLGGSGAFQKPVRRNLNRAGRIRRTNSA